MPNIANVTTEELKRHLSSADFDLIDFVPSSLSAEENQKALETMSKYSELYVQSMADFLDLYKEKKTIQDQIAITEKKVKPGCLMNLLILFASYFLGAFSVGLIGTIVLLGIYFVSPTFMDNEKNFPFVFFPMIVLSIGAWIFFAIKLRKWIINKKDLANLDSLKQHFASIQMQMGETLRNLGYPTEANEEQVCDEIYVMADNFSKVADLLQKREVIHNDTTLSPSACLLAMEKLYDVLRQEKHNKAMEQATLDAADRIASEVAKQEETNRMINAFLAGLSSGRDD